MPIDQHDLRIQTTARTLEACIRRLPRRNHTAITGKIAAGIGQSITMQAFTHAALCSVQERAIQRQAGQRQKGNQTQAGRP